MHHDLRPVEDTRFWGVNSGTKAFLKYKNISVVTLGSENG